MSISICDGKCNVIKVHVQIEDKSEFLRYIRLISEKYQVTIACLNQRMIADIQHIITAVTHALRNWKNGEQIARTLEMEILLYSAGTRQTGEVKYFGPQKGENYLYLCLIPPDNRCLSELLIDMQEEEEDIDLIDEDKVKRLIEWYGITHEEINIVGEGRLGELVSERSALLTVNH